MMKRLVRSVIAVLTLCLALTCFAACGNKSSDNSGKGKNLAAVDKDSIRFEVDADGVYMLWNAVENAEYYVITCNGVKAETDDTSVNFERVDGFVLPNDRVFNITIYARADGYKNSPSVKLTHTVEGIDLVSPRVKSFDNGVLGWSSVAGATAYKVAVNGTVVAEAQEATTLDISAYEATPGTLRVDISAVSNNGVYRRESAKTTVGINAERTKLMLLPITEFTLKNGVIGWEKNGGAKAYKIVDINQTVAATVTGTSYDMNDKILVYGIYPVSASADVEDADMTEPSDIKYLEGEGTAAHPYLIKTTFDLRAIDYYETLYAEALKTAPATQPNVYRVENNLNYNSVAALDEASNIYTLTRPFYGTLDGNNKILSNLRVRYDGGYWALFDYITSGATVKNIIFDTVDIYNEIVISDKGEIFPLDTSIATVAHNNYGTIQGITVKNALYIAKGGDVCGIATYNHKGATISGCSLIGDNEFKQEDTGIYSQACFEMAGITIENSGAVNGCLVRSLTIRGTVSSYVTEWDKGTPVDFGYFNNVSWGAGIASYNRAGGIVSGNTYGTIDMICMVADVNTQAFGGIVALDSGSVSDNIAGTLTWSSTQNVGAAVTADYGTSSRRVGKIRGYRG